MLDPAVLTSIGDLELIARVTVDGTVAGLHRSPFHGYSAEFSQYRHYRPGDDLKYVDWKLFARTDRFYTKQYRETTNLTAQIAVDASASMAYAGSHGVAKIDYARMLAASLAHLISTQGDAVGVSIYGDTLRTYIAARTGQAHLRGVLISLSRMSAHGVTAAAPAWKGTVDLLRRRGLLILISDFYDEERRVEEELRRATRIGHDVALFQILTREEVEFPFGGDFRFEDLESHERVVTGAAAAADYRREMSAFLDRWRTRCAANGIDYTLITADTPVDEALRKYLIRRSAGAWR